ncbi:MAG: hypothetical protein LBH35_00135 [Treponema sp.]|jgi:hypothetical protein|nr:hypothetical protein [Treponema sp.]
MKPDKALGDSAGPGTGSLPGRGMSRFPPETFISAFASLLLLYLTACIAVSVLGGIIDFILYDVLLETN